MNTYYKYYSYLDPEYFTDPTIKISQPYLLNDPFEQFLPEDAVEVILNDFIENAPEHRMTGEMIQRLRETFHQMTSGTGIVSLSETHRNLLMWSHYADSHKGLCIGYKKDFLSSLPPLESKTDRSKYTPVKVNYDSCRFDIEKYEYEKPIFLDISLNSLITKSNDWIYEKEHRCLISFAWADKVVIKGDLSSMSKIQSEWTLMDDKIKTKTERKVEGKDGIKIEKTISFKNEYLYLYATLLKEREVLILKNIKQESISEIYFGCMSDKDYINSIVDLINENKNKLGHIKLYKYETSPTRFELKSTRINI